jgi:uncharacterized protein with HEPN domain
MSKEPKEYLRHIYDECQFLLSVSKDLSEENFLKDETLKRAVVRSLEIIGEATKKDSCRHKNSMEYNSMEKYGRNAR